MRKDSETALECWKQLNANCISGHEWTVWQITKKKAEFFENTIKTNAIQMCVIRIHTNVLIRCEQKKIHDSCNKMTSSMGEESLSGVEAALVVILTNKSSEVDLRLLSDI